MMLSSVTNQTVYLKNVLNRCFCCLLLILSQLVWKLLLHHIQNNHVFNAGMAVVNTECDGVLYVLWLCATKCNHIGMYVIGISDCQQPGNDSVDIVFYPLSHWIHKLQNLTINFVC